MPERIGRAFIGTAVEQRGAHGVHVLGIGRARGRIESGDAAHGSHTARAVRGRLVPCGAAARRSSLAAVQRSPGAAARRAADRGADAASGGGRGRGALARAGARGAGSRTLRAAHALDRARPCAADVRRPGGARSRARPLARVGRPQGDALLRRGLVLRRARGRCGRGARLRGLHCDGLPPGLPGARGGAPAGRRAAVARARERQAPARASDHALARHARARRPRSVASDKSCMRTSTTPTCSTARERRPCERD